MASGTTIETTTFGTHTLTVAAINAFGTETETTRTFRVVGPLVFDGFLPPLEQDDPANPQVLNGVRAGKKVSLKWTITGWHGRPITSASGITVEHRFGPRPGVAGSFGPWTDAPFSGGGLEYKGDKFESKLETSKQWVGRCGAVRVTFGGGQTAEARFSCR